MATSYKYFSYYFWILPTYFSMSIVLPIDFLVIDITYMGIFSLLNTPFIFLPAHMTMYWYFWLCFPVGSFQLQNTDRIACCGFFLNSCFSLMFLFCMASCSCFIYTICNIFSSSLSILFKVLEQFYASRIVLYFHLLSLFFPTGSVGFSLPPC